MHKKQEHDLKVWPEFWAPLESGEKTFEIRLDDRGFQVGETLYLHEWSEAAGYTGREMRRRVTYLLGGAWPGLAPGYVVMGLEPIVANQRLIELTEHMGETNQRIVRAAALDHAKHMRGLVSWVKHELKRRRPRFPSGEAAMSEMLVEGGTVGATIWKLYGGKETP